MTRMKRIILMTLIGLLLTGCSTKLPTPPTPALTVDGKNVPVVRGSYSWYKYGRGINVDTVSPPELVKQLEPVPVAPGARLTIDFTYKPRTGSLLVNKWVGGQPVSQDLEQGNVIVLPKQKGKYVYDFFAEWKEGSASYAFIVEVKERNTAP